jgi:hypothetical protein
MLLYYDTSSTYTSIEAFVGWVSMLKFEMTMWEFIFLKPTDVANFYRYNMGYIP